MIVVMNRKFFEKHVKKLVEPANYVVVDGENYAVTGSNSEEVAIASRYSNSVSIGGYTPEMRLWSMLKKLNHGEEINRKRFDIEVETFLEDRAFISAVVKTLRGLFSCGYDAHINIFVVLPNLVYKHLSEAIIEAMIDLIDLRYRIVFSKEELKAFGYKKLEIPLNKRMLREIHDRVDVLEKKHKIKYKKEKDWDDDD